MTGAERVTFCRECGKAIEWGRSICGGCMAKGVHPGQASRRAGKPKETLQELQTRLEGMERMQRSLPGGRRFLGDARPIQGEQSSPWAAAWIIVIVSLVGAALAWSGGRRPNVGVFALCCAVANVTLMWILCRHAALSALRQHENERENS